MTLLGEPPIWSYFKPKTASNSHPSKRRKNGYSGTESSKDREPEAKDSGRKGKTKATTSENPLSPDLPPPRTPDVPSLRKRKGLAIEEFLPTPSATTGGPSRRLKEISSSLKASSSLNTTTPASKQTGSFVVPPPPHFKISQYTGIAPKPSNEDRITATDENTLEDTQSIPSSQTQTQLILLGIDHSLDSNSSRRRNLPPVNLHGDSVDGSDGLSIIQSSQSQLPLHIQDDRPNHFQEINTTDTRNHDIDSFNECIPSSQSQEIELRIPKEGEEHEGFRLNSKQSCSRANRGIMYYTTNPHLKRTFSDEIPLSVYETFPSDIFQKEIQNDPPLKSALPNSHEGDDVDSVTESESEDIGSQQNDLRHGSRPPGSVRELPRQGTPLQGSSYDASQEDTTLSIDAASQSFSDDPRILPLIPQSQGCFSESLPQDLRELFGNSDDSFPPDFPMSLR